MKSRALLQTIGIKTSAIIFLLILIYSIPVILKQQFYPILAFNMFADPFHESIGTTYVPYVIDQQGRSLIFDQFNPWPIRRSDLHHTVSYWQQNNQTQTRFAKAGPHLLRIARERNPSYKCYGVAQLNWPLLTPPEQIWEHMQRQTVVEHCDEK